MSGYPCTECGRRWPTRWCEDCQRGPDRPQSSLFDDPDPSRITHRNDPDTSKAAAQLPRTGIRRRVAEHLAANPSGLTDDEIHALGTGTRHRHSTATRRLELQDQGWVVDTGDRRPSPDGNDAVVWAWTGPKIA